MTAKGRILTKNGGKWCKMYSWNEHEHRSTILVLVTGPKYCCKAVGLPSLCLKRLAALSWWLKSLIDGRWRSLPDLFKIQIREAAGRSLVNITSVFFRFTPNEVNVAFWSLTYSKFIYFLPIMRLYTVTFDRIWTMIINKNVLCSER